MIQLTHANVALPATSTMARLKAVLLPRPKEANEQRALYDFTLWLGKSETWAVLGEEGAGKTTLLRLIAGRILPQSGVCQVSGRVAAAIAQEDALIAHESGAANIQLNCHAQNMNKAQIEARVKEVAAFSNLQQNIHQAVSEYDAAMRARLVLSIALLSRPDVLVVSNMLEQCDLPFQRQCVLELRKQQRGGMTLLLESANGSILQRLCDSALWLNKGRLHRLGAFDTIYAAYHYPAMQQSGQAKAWLATQRAAFSAALAPANGASAENDPSQWPQQARQALLEAELYAKRLDEQLAAFSQANIAFEQENARLDATVRENEARLWQAEAMLTRVLRALTNSMKVMQDQFLLLNKLFARRE